jgi:hypothetical protein
MLPSLTRRNLMVGSLATPLILTTPAIARQVALDSGGIGLTRAECDALMSLDDAPVAVPGHAIWDETYATVGEQYAANYVSFFDVGGEPVCVYFEDNNFPEDGLDTPSVRERLAYRMPSDAELTDLAIAPPTPAGETAFRVERYTSAALDAAHGGTLAPEILAVLRERWAEEGGTRTIGYSLMIRQITQEG